MYKFSGEKGIGATNFQGLTKQKEGAYVNEAFETADIIIAIRAEVGVGEANFIVKES